MTEGSARRLLLELESGELEALKAAIATGLEETKLADASSAQAHARLLAVRQVVDALAASKRYRVPLEREDADILRACVTRVISLRGYIVARPAAIGALVSLHQKLDRLLLTNQ
jgi:hypothetical protein